MWVCANNCVIEFCTPRRVETRAPVRTFGVKIPTNDLFLTDVFEKFYVIGLGNFMFGQAVDCGDVDHSITGKRCSNAHSLYVRYAVVDFCTVNQVTTVVNS